VGICPYWVNAKGQISQPANGLGHEDLQAHLLRNEGVRFKEDVIPLARFGWQPRSPRRGD
jgi:alkylated DNA nucleotide flippase Atl1